MVVCFLEVSGVGVGVVVVVLLAVVDGVALDVAEALPPRAAGRV